MPSPVSQPLPAVRRESATGGSWPSHRLWLLTGLLLLLTVVLYWPSLHHGFVSYDDTDYVTKNPHVATGLSLVNMRWALSSGYAANWHPITWLSHMLDVQLFGLTPSGHHLTSLVLHAMNASLLFAWLRRLTGATWRSLCVAVLFVVHPLRVESVAWVAERKDLLSGLFGFLSLMAYTRYARGLAMESSSAFDLPEVAGRRSWPAGFFWGLSLLFFALGLMSKPMLVSWPLVMLLLDFWPLARVSSKNIWRLVLEKVPFFALAVGSSLVTMVVQKHGHAQYLIGGLSLGARIGNALISYCRYLGAQVWPVDLAVFYPHPLTWPMGKVLLASAGLLGISAVSYSLRRRCPYVLMGWLWYLLTLAPVIGLIQVGGQAMADRYTYLPSVGLLIPAIWGMYDLTRDWTGHRVLLSAMGLVSVAICLVLTRQQLGYWKDSETLFWHAIDVTENNYIAHSNLGDDLFRRGRIDEASEQFEEAISIKPDFAPAHCNLGAAFASRGQLNQAISEYREAIRLKPDWPPPYNNLGIALARLGRMDEAEACYQQAVRLNQN